MKLYIVLFLQVVSSLVFFKPNSKPLFPGGQEALDKYIFNNVHYPLLQEKPVDFNVVAEVAIREDGTASLISTSASINLRKVVEYEVTRQVNELICNMPAWEPATQETDGRIMAIKDSVQITIPFHRYYIHVPGKIAIELKEAGTLDKMLTQEQMDTCRYLEVRGKVNSRDIAVLRKMAGGDGGKGCLKLLDMSKAKIVTDRSTPYLTINAVKYGLEAKLHRIYPVETSFGGIRSNANPANSVSFVSFPQVNRSTTYYRYKQGENRPIDKICYVLNDNVIESSEDSGDWYKQKNLNQANLRMKKIQKFKGHVLTISNGNYILKAYTVKGTYCKDMFYHCPSLQYVIIPWRIKINKDMDVQFLGHKYI